jgi:hypothetical protein
MLQKLVHWATSQLVGGWLERRSVKFQSLAFFLIATLACTPSLVLAQGGSTTTLNAANVPPVHGGGVVVDGAVNVFKIGSEQAAGVRSVHVLRYDAVLGLISTFYVGNIYDTVQATIAPFNALDHAPIFAVNTFGTAPNVWSLTAAELTRFRGTFVPFATELEAIDITWDATIRTWTNPVLGSDEDISVEVMDPESAALMQQIVDMIDASGSVNLNGGWLPQRPSDFVVADGGVVSPWIIGFGIITAAGILVTLAMEIHQRYFRTPAGCRALSMHFFDDCIRVRDQLYPVPNSNDPAYNPCWFSFGLCCGQKYASNIAACDDGDGTTNPLDNHMVCDCAMH